MATAKKHMERSHRSHHASKPFANFEMKAGMKKAQEVQRKSILEMVKSLFHRTTSK